MMIKDSKKFIITFYMDRHLEHSQIESVMLDCQTVPHEQQEGSCHKESEQKSVEM